MAQTRSNNLTGVFQASDFSQPTLGQEGTLGRNTFDQPGYNNINATLGKFIDTPFFFVEVTNLFNRVNPLGVNSVLSSTLFGHSTNQLPSQYLQFHLCASF